VAVVGVHQLDPGHSLARVLGLGPREVWVIRPDGHIAATLDAPSEVALLAAIRAALGHRADAVHGAACAIASASALPEPDTISEEERRGPLSPAR
jgi:hypothetical protein